MSSVKGLPGFEVILRTHKRLASKLTTDEFRAIRDYIEERCNQEVADINFKLYALQNDYDVTVRKSSDTITDLYQELNEKKDIIKRYQNSDEAISGVHKQKEERWERKQNLLLTEIEKLDNEATKAKKKINDLENQLEEKTGDCKRLEEELAEVKKVANMVEEAKAFLDEREEKKKELFQIKVELEKRDRTIQQLEKNNARLKLDLEEFHKENELNEMKVNSMKTELRKQVGEVAEKCKDLSELQFQLQMEQRQTEKLQKELKQATADVQNFKKMLEAARPPLDDKDPVAITVRKDLDIMDIRIRSLDLSVRLRMDEIRKIEERLDDIKDEERLGKQIKSEIYQRGDSFIELTVLELIKHLDFKRKRLMDELKSARNWDQPLREADTLRTEIGALLKQTSICKMMELNERASRQLQKIDLIMRGVSDTTKMPRVYRVSDRMNSDRRANRYQTRRTSKTPSVSSETQSDGNRTKRTSSPRSHRRLSVAKTKYRSTHNFGQSSPLDNHTDDSKLQYIDTVELDLSRVTPTTTPQRGSQTDRMTLKSVSTVNY